MPRPISSDRYLTDLGLDAPIGDLQLEEDEFPKLEPLLDKPDFLSITWLASKVKNRLVSGAHMSATGVYATIPIGEGATFSVYRLRRKYRDEAIHVIKRPRQLFEQGKDEEHVFDQLYSLHLELRVLTDSQIRLHPNIVKLLDVTWEEHPDDLGRYWPSLILEFATLGTLSNYFERGENPSLHIQHQICYGVGSGLEFLHQRGVVHGDVKCDNVLLFESSSGNGIIPKLGDFGYSVLDGENSRPLKGTYPFKAPELHKGGIARNDIIYTDVYSFGLLVWQVSQKGHNPFEDRNVCPHSLFSTEAQSHIQKLKEGGELLELALRMFPEDRTCLRHVMELTIHPSPAARKLTLALQTLEKEIHGDITGGRCSTDLRPNRPNTANVEFSPQEMRHLSPPVQKQILLSFKRRTEADVERDNGRRSMAAMSIAISCLEGFGGRKPEEALEWIFLAASLGNLEAKSCVYCVSKALGLFSRDEQLIMSFTIESARNGNPIAIENLLAACPEKGREVLKELRIAMRDKYLPFSDLTSLRAHIREYGIGMSEPIKNPDGNSLLHLAAICRDVSALCLVLEESHSLAEEVDVDVTNYEGQTPLLLAFIAGSFDFSITLLDHGASASKADHKGDTPFHWLHSFNTSQMRTLADALLKQNADVNAISSRQLWYKCYHMIFPRGTPLHRAVERNKPEAVKILLDSGADALLPAPAHELSTPLWIACTYHNFEVLELLLDSIKDVVDVKKIVNGGESEKWPLTLPILDKQYYFLNGATLGRMVRHREKYRISAKETIKALRERGALGCRGGDLSLLMRAILHRSFDIVEAVLDEYPALINIPSIPQKETPLHLAVLADREDLLNLLLSRGADPFARRTDELDALGLYAIYRKGLEIPRILLQRGLKFEIPPSGLETPFFGAVAHRAFELATYILENTAESERDSMINALCFRGARARFGFTKPGATILGYLLAENSIFSLPAVRYLLHLPDIYGRIEFIVFPGEGKSALHFLAASRRDIRDDVVSRALAIEILQYFSSREDIDLANKLNGNTALWEAVRSLNYDMIDLLLSRGASPTIASHNGQTPLTLLFRQIVYSKEHPQGHDAIKKLEQIQNLFASYGYSPVDPGNVSE
ncbi:hypothetical protein K440DRAFT_661597 [Wilcoxina mikolae CBS 423.85]|nr:hypothetical protein K440DRAFT_661597 [Wilcoxina mikolae CBS 423.85]